MVMSLKQIKIAHEGKDDLTNLKIALGRIILASDTTKSIIFFNTMSIERMRARRLTTDGIALSFSVPPLEEYPAYKRMLCEIQELQKELLDLQEARTDIESKITALKE
jgi:hypothetical protein